MNKLQALLINHLLKHGSVKLLLPDEVVLEIGVNQVGKDGELVNTENYCWVMTSKADRMTVFDSYNLGLRFADKKDTIIFEDTFIDSEGQSLRRLDVI